MNILESILLAIANLLYYPVLLGVLLVLLHQVVAVGKFMSELKQRRNKNFKRIQAFKAQHADYFKAPAATYKVIEYDLVSKLRKWHQSYNKSLSANRLVVKAGPSLGLLGTLIPMGTALASLSQGDLMIMSANMVTAFTTTVVGMASGLTAFLMHYKQTEWMKRDLLECESLCERSLMEWENELEHTENLINS
ncbi:MotA/TolQ/ExbB proton channel family protein [Ulvibacterium sp.]|uniref:MotA/TolQ/ExbB proton channel family protein n=1 Tax=Ulvibacterium sp. TaxID=2665914 RepID=UPI0026046DE0|nr:MotA/TolQ/ExbB proton channel family protein [Ulvibacterium sp.]